jgi:hypothetical protein
MLTGGETNTRPIVPDEHGPAFINQVAAKIAALDAHAVIPHEIKEARTLLAELEASGGSATVRRQSAGCGM